MGFPQSYAGAVAHIITGRLVQPGGGAVMQLGVNVPCRRVLLVANAGSTVYVVSEREAAVAPAAAILVGMLMPSVQADGNFTPMELWVNNVSVIWVVGTGGEIVTWLAEQY